MNMNILEITHREQATAMMRNFSACFGQVLGMGDKTFLL